MKITVNGKPVETSSGTLAALLDELGHGGKRIATAVNEEFVPATKRASHQLAAGDRVEIVAPRQGG
jgi:sulfur carrier protein